jgi:AcrR family transcriptional regulator
MNTINTLTRGEQTRAAIIQSAYELFIEQGYHGTSMRQIAKGANIALGGLYNHFDSKIDVFHAVFVEYHPYHELLPSLMQAQGESIEEIVRDAAHRVVAILEDRPDFFNLMFIEVVEFQSIHTHELFKTLLPQATLIANRFIQTDPEHLRDIPPPMLIRSFMGLFFSYFLTEIILAPGAPQEFTENAMDYLVDIYLHGVLNEA